MIMGFSFQSKKPLSQHHINQPTTSSDHFAIKGHSIEDIDVKPENNPKFHQSKFFNLGSWTDK